MLSEYGFDLVDNFNTVGARRLWVLIQGLPESAALYREEAWTRQDEFLASLLELTDAWGHLMVAVHGGKLKGNAKPLRVRRPWEAEDPGRKVFKLADQKEMMAYFNQRGLN